MSYEQSFLLKLGDGGSPVSYETVAGMRTTQLSINGDYDESAPIGTGDTPSEAIIDWLELHGETIDE